MSNTVKKTEMEQFDHFRQVLLDLVQESTELVQELQKDPDLRSCAKKVLDHLAYHGGILKQNIMPTSLFAAFQKGKSTTATAMTDGREITPSGRVGGLRTSALSVTIYHDPHNTEVKINPYTKEQLLHTILELAGCHLENPDPAAYDLDNPEDRLMLAKAVKREVEVYRQDNNYDLEKLSILRNCILIMAFYGCPEHQNLLAGAYTSLEGIRPFISFSSSEEQKWADLRKMGCDIVYARKENGDPVFCAEECLHVFIEDISIPVHSEFMEETGTAVIDSPGVMASTEDTRRALKAAHSAAVVLYILDGETQLSQGDKEMLRVLKNAGMAEKVVFAVNFRRNPDIIRQEGGIEESILSTLKQEGYCEPHHGSLLYYNAYLAVRAGQGRLILNDTMDPMTEASILEDAAKRQLKVSSVEEAWCKTTCKVLRAVDADDTADLIIQNGICLETVEAVEQASCWKDTIVRLRRHVTNNRAAGILRDLGAAPVQKAVADVEKELHIREERLIQTASDAEENFRKASDLHTKFSHAVDEELDLNFPAIIDTSLANDFFDNVILPAADLAAQESAGQIFKETGVVANLKGMGDKIKRFGERAINAASTALGYGNQVEESAPNGVREKCSGIISANFDKALAQYSHRWSVNLETSDIYTAHITNNVLRTKRNLTNLWHTMGLAENEMLRHIPPVPKELSGKMSKDLGNSSICNILIDTGMAAGSQIAQIMKSLLSGMGTFVGLSFIYLYILPLDFVIPFAAEIVTILSGTVAAIVYAVSESQKEKKIQQIQLQIAKDLRNGLVADKPKIFKNILDGDPNANPPAQGIGFIRSFYVELFKGAVKQQRQTLEENYQQALNDLALSQAARDALAEKAHNWRTQRIEPLRIRLDDVLSQIRSIWG